MHKKLATLTKRAAYAYTYPSSGATAPYRRCDALQGLMYNMLFFCSPTFPRPASSMAMSLLHYCQDGREQQSEPSDE